MEEGMCKIGVEWEIIIPLIVFDVIANVCLTDANDRAITKSANPF